MMPRIVGISGAAGAGKDTVAEYLMQEYGYGRVSFAKPMKDAIQAMFGVDSRIWERDVKEKPLDELIGFSPRQLAQTLGTEWGRGLRESFWIDLAKLKIVKMLRDGQPVVISDVRFNNEARMIQEMGGVVIGVIRPALAEKRVRKHISEAGLDEDLVTAVLLNDGRLSEIPSKVEYVLREIMEMTGKTTRRSV